MAKTAKKYDILSWINNYTFLRVLRAFDNQIARNLSRDGIETRPSNSHGLWCCTLLPTILVLYSLQFQVSLLYKLIACISVGILCYCFLFVTFLSVSCLVLRQRIIGGCAAATILSTLLIYGVLAQNLMFSLIYSAIPVYSFCSLLKGTIKKYPKTFTIGEAMVVIQAIVLFMVATVTKLFSNIGDNSDNEMNFVNSINFALFASVGVIVVALVKSGDRPTNLKMLSKITGVAGIVALVILHRFIGTDCIIGIVYYIFMDLSKLKLFLFWCLTSGLAAVVLVLRTKMAVKASTVTRKTFHVLASLVFMSGIVCDVHLMTLASGFGLAAIILAETFRKSNIEMVTPALQSAFQVYSDEKDTGSFAMTPIYLYVGLACPLILVPVHEDYQLELLSGVLSIGIGDTAASWFGAKYGFNKWSDGHKSLEGTGFNILSQIATIYVLDMFEILLVRNSVLKTIIAAVISGLVEAKTDQIDNLVLPLVTIIAFQITWFI